MKKVLKKHLKKALSILLAMTFVISSAATLTAFAAEPSEEVNQIGKYYELDENGLGGTGFDSSQKTSEDGMVTVEKNISAVDENVFDIELVVTTKDSTAQIPVSKDTAVVLVMDVSNSMTRDIVMEGSTMTRIAAAKQAACSFVDDYIQEAADAKRMLSIVEFGSNAKTVLNWVDAKGDNTDDVKVAIKDDVQIGFSDSRFSGTDSGGTNIEGGLTLAYNLLGQTGSGQPLEGITSLYVIMLSDGAPTYHIHSNADRNSTEFILGARGGGSEADYEDDVVPAEAAAENVKTRATLYSIAFASGSSLCYEIQEWIWVPGYWWGFIYIPGHYEYSHTDVTVEEWLTSISEGYYSANDADELAAEFKAIVERIRKLSESGIVMDPMGDYIVFDEEYNVDYNGFSVTDNAAPIYFDKVAGTIVWNVSDIEPEVSAQDNITYYTYRLKYRTILDTVAIKLAAPDGDVDNNAYYPTNKPTYMNYQIVENDEVIDTATIYFRVPTVRAFYADFEFDKIAAHDEDIKLSGAEFALYNDDSSLVMTATADSEGVVSFIDIPAGYYTLEETAAPEGYDVSDERYLIAVSYGVLEVWDLSENIIEKLQYKNSFTQDYVTISGAKIWENMPAGETYPEVTIILKQDGEEINRVTLSEVYTFEFNEDKLENRLPKFREDFTEYEYTVDELTVEGYTKQIDGFVITNTYIDRYFYQINRNYKYYLNGVLQSDITVTGVESEGTENQVITADQNDYLVHDGKTYDFVDGPVSITLTEKNGITELNLYYVLYEEDIPEPPIYSYKINVNYKTLRNGVFESEKSIMGDVVETTDQTLELNKDDYKMYEGNEYAYVSGETSVTLEEDVIKEINLVYERNIIDDPEPPLDPNYRYKVNVTYKTLRNGVFESEKSIMGDVVETTDQTLELNKDDYKMYEGNEYAYVSGETSVTLEEDVIKEISLVFERNIIEDPEPPYTGMSSNIGLFASLAIASGASLTVMALSGKKKNKR